MESIGRCKCDECKSTEMLLHELDVTTPIMIVTTRERELLGARVA